MAQGFSAEVVGVLDGTLNPPAKFDGRLVGAKLRASRAVLDLAAATTKTTNGDTNLLFRFPAGCRPVALLINATVDLGAAATIAVGIAGTAAKYKAAAVFRNADTPTLVMLAAAAAAAPLAAFEDVIMTIATANLPGVGVVTIDGIYSAR